MAGSGSEMQHGNGSTGREQMHERWYSTQGSAMLGRDVERRWVRGWWGGMQRVAIATAANIPIGGLAMAVGRVYFEMLGDGMQFGR
jgi:hypothetical protein